MTLRISEIGNYNRKRKQLLEKERKTSGREFLNNSHTALWYPQNMHCWSFKALTE